MLQQIIPYSIVLTHDGLNVQGAVKSSPAKLCPVMAAEGVPIWEYAEIVVVNSPQTQESGNGLLRFYFKNRYRVIQNILIIRLKYVSM